MSTIALRSLQPLIDLAQQLGVAEKDIPRIARWAIGSGLSKTRTHVRRSVQELLLLKSASIYRRMRLVLPRGNRLVGDIVFHERNLPLLTSFPVTGGRPGPKGPKLKVRVRVGKPAEVVPAAWRRPNPNVFADPADSGSTTEVSYQRFQNEDGSFVGRMPYDATRGPSPLGLLEHRPGFAEEEQDFMADEITIQFQTRAGRLLDALGDY